MFRPIFIAIGIGLLGVSFTSFAAVTGIWPVQSIGAEEDISGPARAQLDAKPLYAQSYYALGIVAEQAGDSARAQALIDRAARLNPRLRAARLWLLENSASSGQAEQAIQHASAMAGLNPMLEPAISVILAELSRDPAARNLVAARLKNRPMILSIARYASQLGLSREALMDLLQPSDLTQLPNGVETAQSLVVAPLLQDERFSEARLAWYSLSGLAPQSEVFDGTFEGLPGAPPFGWRLSNGPNVETRLEDGVGPGGVSALKVTTFGSLLVTAAEQSLTLSPGSHELRFASLATVAEEGESAFAWTVSCRSGAFITEALVEQSTTDWVSANHRFIVPGDCPMQVLRLVKRGTPDRSAKTLQLTSVSIAPA